MRKHQRTIRVIFYIIVVFTILIIIGFINDYYLSRANQDDNNIEPIYLAKDKYFTEHRAISIYELQKILMYNDYYIISTSDTIYKVKNLDDFFKHSLFKKELYHKGIIIDYYHYLNGQEFFFGHLGNKWYIFTLESKLHLKKIIEEESKIDSIEKIQNSPLRILIKLNNKDKFLIKTIDIENGNFVIKTDRDFILDTNGYLVSYYLDFNGGYTLTTKGVIDFWKYGFSWEHLVYGYYKQASINTNYECLNGQLIPNAGSSYISNYGYFGYIADNYISIISYNSYNIFASAQYEEYKFTCGTKIDMKSDFILVGDKKGEILIFKIDEYEHNLELIWHKKICSTEISNVYTNSFMNLYFGVYCGDEFHSIQFDLLFFKHYSLY